MNAAGDDTAVERLRWFYEEYVTQVEAGQIDEPPGGMRCACVCCGYPTLESGICPLCWWADDGSEDVISEDEPDNFGNHGYSLAEARRNFAKYLTMHRPGDTHKSLTGPDALAAKRKIIEAFDAMRREHSSEAINRLWRVVYEYEAKLDAILDEELRREGKI